KGRELSGVSCVCSACRVCAVGWASVGPRLYLGGSMGAVTPPPLLSRELPCGARFSFFAPPFESVLAWADERVLATRHPFAVSALYWRLAEFCVCVSRRARNRTNGAYEPEGFSPSP